MFFRDHLPGIGGRRKRRGSGATYSLPVFYPKNRLSATPDPHQVAIGTVLLLVHVDQDDQPVSLGEMPVPDIWWS